MAQTLGLALSFREAYQAIKSVVEVIDDYKKTTIAIAATLTDTAKASGDELKLIYQDNAKYAEDMYGKVELAASKFFASGKEMVEAWQILTNKGIRLTSDDDINNLGIIVDKIKLVTQGQSSSLQIAQELRSALSGQARAGDQLAMLLEDRLGPSWKQLLEEQVKSGDAIEFIASQIKGVGVATEDIQNTIASQLSTQETLISQIVRSGFKEMYQDSLVLMQQINGLLERNKALIADTLGAAYKVLKVVMSLGSGFGLARAAMEFPKDDISGGSNEIRQTVRHVVLGQSLFYSDIQQQVKNSLKHEDSFLKTPLSDQSQEIVDRYAKAYESMQKAVDSGKLDASGLASTGELWIKTMKSEQVELDGVNKKLHSGDKAAANAAIAAERYGERASAFLDQTLSALDQLQDSLTGGTEKNTNRVDAWFEKQFDAIRKAVVGAKGDVSQYAAAWVALENAWPGDHILATTKDTIAALKSQAQILQDIAQATGDPGMLYAAEKKAAEAWYAEKKQLVENSIKDESEKSAALEALEEGYNAKLLDAKAKAYQDLAGVSSQYWDAESQLLDLHLKHVKENCDSEYAYEVYAAQKRSDLRKKELEARIGYEKDFLSTLSDALSLEFGLYKDANTRQHDSWVSLSKDIASGVNDLSNTIAGGATDAFKTWVTGSGSMADAFKSALDSMFDYLMNILQKMISYALKNYVIIPIVEQVVGSDVASSLTGSGSSSGTGSGSGSLSNSAMSKITNKAADYGVSKGISYVSDLFSGGGTSLSALSAASATEMSALGTTTATSLAEGAGYTAVTSGAAEGGALAGASSAGAGIGLGTALGVVGGVAALGGLLIGGLSTTKTEQKTGSGLQITLVGDSASVGTADYYKVTSSNMFGSSTSHEIRSTGMADSETTDSVNSALAAYTDVIVSGFDKLGVETKDSLSNFYFPQWDVAPGQEGDYYENVSNAKVGKVLADSGLLGPFQAIAKTSESWITQITRLNAAMTTVGTATQQMGLSLESLAGEDYISGLVDKMLAAGDSAGTAGMDFSALAGVLDDDTLASLKDMQAQAAATGDEVQATNEQLRQLAIAQYASEIVDAFGSTDAAQSAFNRYFTNAYSATEQATRLMQYYAEGAGEAIAALNDSGVGLENFWGSYRAAMESGSLSPEQLKGWDDAAQWVEAFDSSLKSAGQAWEETNQTIIDGINDQIKALESQRDAIKDTLAKWSDFLDSIKELRRSIKLDSDLTNLSPKELYEQKKALFDTTAAKARAGDEKAMAELPDVTKDFLEASRDYWASSEQYYQDFEHADETLASLEDYAQTQVDQAQAQLDAINNEISVLQLQVNQLTLVNSNLGNLGNLMGDGVNAIVSAINNSTFSSSYVDAINAANAAQADAAASLLTSLGGSTGFSDSGSDTGFDWPGGGLEVDEDGNWVGFSEGGLARGGVPGVDSIPAKLMDGERVIDVKHTKILEWLVEGGNTNRVDTSGIESRLDRVASTSAMASRANQVAIDGVRREMAGIRNKLSRDARRPKARTR